MYLVTGLLGIAFMAAPFLLGFDGTIEAMWASVVLGAAVFLVSAVEAFRTTEVWEYWVAGILGIAAIAAPFVLGFTGETLALWTSLVIGAGVLIASGAKVFRFT